MQDNDVIIFTEDIYSEHLSTINNLKFTPREIDVMACLLSARRTSQIASMLSIAPRTVTTHFRNIMLRLDCNSQEGIINFVERSHKLSILREYYSILIIELAFKKALKEISKLRKDKIASCLIVYWQDQGIKNAFLCHLENHLSQAGIITEIREHRLDEKIENVDNPNQILLFLIEKKNNLDITQKPAAHKFIDFSEHLNYYLAIFEILQELLPNTDLKIIFKKFIEQYEGINSVSRDKSPPASRKEKLDINENRIIYNVLQTLKNRKKPFISAFLVICLFVVGVIIFKDNKEESQSYIQTRNAAKERTIRSDLVMPAETVLLHRPELISQIDEKFKGHSGIQTVALVGPGGAGKTTLGRQYAHQQKANVIWEINAETHENLERSFENLAEVLSKTKEDKVVLRGIQEMKNSIKREEKIIQFVKERFKLKSNWVLIFDSVEKFIDIQNYFPQDSATWGNGKIILTTRDSNIQNNKCVNYIVRIGELTPHQKLNLFTKIMKTRNIDSFTTAQTEEIKKFLEAISPFPLDISIAAYYLKSTNVPYQKYLENLAQNNKDFASIQENLLKEAGNYTRTRYGIITLSLKHLIDTHKDFADLLLFISLLDSQNIPRELLDKYKNNVIVDNFIYNLKKYSLITSEPTYSSQIFTFSLHRSTQEISLAYLLKTLDLEKNKLLLDPALDILESYLISVIEKEDLTRLKLIITHGEKVLNLNNLLTYKRSGSLGSKIGSIYYCLSDYKKAEEILRSNLSLLKKYSRNSYDVIASNLIYLGTIYWATGKFQESKKFFEEGIEIYNDHFPDNHAGFCRGLVELGNVYRTFGNYEKAKNLLEHSLCLYKKYFSQDYAGFLKNLGSLGLVYSALGNYEKAIAILEQGAVICEIHFPQNHIRIGEILGKLGIVYTELGQYNKAINLFKRSLESCENHSPNHIGVALGYADLGNVYRMVGDYKKAQYLLEKSLSLHKKQFGDNNFRTGWVLSLLGNLHRDLGNYEKARDFLQQNLIIHKEFGKEHIRVALVSVWLGITYRELGFYKEAQEILENNLKIHKKCFGENHISISYISFHIGIIHKALGNLHEAEQLFYKSLLAYEKHYGKNHIETARILKSLGQNYLLQDDIKNAEAYFGNALNIFQKNNHSDLYMIYEDLAQLYQKKSTLEINKVNIQQAQQFETQAFIYLKKALELVKTHFPEDSPHIIRIQNKLNNIK